MNKLIYLINKCFKILKSKKIFYKLNNYKILILDNVGSEKLINSLSLKDFHILFDRYEEIHIPILIKSLFFVFKYKKYSYKILYIKKINPKIAITFIDTSLYYANIFKFIPSCKLIFVQNGRGGSYRFNNIKEKSLRIDYYLINSNCYKEYASKFIISKYYITGSILSNLFNKPILNKVKRIQWISQFKERDMSFNGRFYNIEDVVNKPIKYYICLILDFCNKHKVDLEIIPLSHNQREINFYKSISPNIKILKRIQDDYLSSYKQFKEDAIVVGMDSQLVYESLAIGFRTAFLSRQKFVNDDSWGFAWPMKISTHGFFWSNDPNKYEINKILLNLLNVSNNKWNQILKEHEFAMSYDFQNKISKNLINKLLL